MQICTNPVVNLYLLIPVAVMLLVFGIVYDRLIASLGPRTKGFLAILVAAGVIVTLVGVAIISWSAAVLTAVMFVASGLPMLVGDISRYIREREKTERRLREIMTDDQPAKQ